MPFPLFYIKCQNNITFAHLCKQFFSVLFQKAGKKSGEAKASPRFILNCENKF